METLWAWGILNENQYIADISSNPEEFTPVTFTIEGTDSLKIFGDLKNEETL